MKTKHFFLNDEPAATPGDVGAASTPVAQPEPVSPAPVPTTAELSDAAIAKIVESLKAEMAGKAPEPEPVPEPIAPPTEPEPDPRDATMRSLLIKANGVPDSLIDLLPTNPTEAEKVIQSEKFQALITREKLAATVQNPDPSAPKPSAPQGDAKTAPIKPRTFAELTVDHRLEVDNALKGII
jgi:hypothetical protein